MPQQSFTPPPKRAVLFSMTQSLTFAYSTIAYTIHPVATIVCANYQNLDKNIPYTMEYLNKFFGNLLLGDKNRIDNREMQIKESGVKTTLKILDILAKNPSATRAELVSATGLSPDGVKWNLDKLKKSGKICRIGPERGGYWEFV